MGTIKKADLMINNGTDYDKILFSTTAEQVEYANTDGTTSDLQTKLQNIGTVLLDTSRALNTFGIVNEKYGINTFDYVMVTLSVNSKSHTMTCYADKKDGSYAATWGYGIDSTFVEWIVQFDTAGRYLTNTKAYRSINRGTWQELTASMNITRIVGFTFF